MQIHDLTHPLSTGLAVYPGDPPVQFAAHARLDPDGYRVSEVRCGTHAGTHLDAPAHFLRDGVTVEQLSLGVLVGPARVVEAADAAGEIQPGERLLLRTGWSRQWGQAGYFTEFPALPEGLAEQLAAAPAALVGLETPSLHPDPEEDARLHRLVLKAGIVIVENLARLEALPRRVFLAVLPLPLTGLDGSPCRVVALEGRPGAESERP